MNYSLKIYDAKDEKALNAKVLVKKFGVFLQDEKAHLAWAFLAIILNSIASVSAPFVLGYTIDHFIQTKNLSGLTSFSFLLAAVYLAVAVTSYFQTTIMGRLGQRVLFKLRRALFAKIQSLPLTFFNQNKLGDLISRINNDTDKLNQFFAQSLIQFLSNIFTLIGIGIFIFFINTKLAVIMLVSALILLGLTYVLSPWINKQNRLSLQALGNLSAEIQESLNFFKVIVAYDRRDYFKENFQRANEQNFSTSFRAGIANNITGPIYDFSGNVAVILVLAYGIHLILIGNLTIGLLVSFLSYTDKFYSPLRQMAFVWSNAQLALAAWNRISEILQLESDMPISRVKLTENIHSQEEIMCFENVNFAYDENKQVLKDVNFALQKGKTYAFVGPTGGGKSTTASLMARLFDPQKGTIYLDGKNIKHFSHEQLSSKIGFILQDQFLFSSTVGENIVYGNPNYKKYSKKKLAKELKDLGLESLINKFEKGLDTPVTPQTESISLGQKQIISFIRAIIRKPALLIMDEATANIDTVTETLLEEIISKLSPLTTKVIIAHRLNTIKNADQIFFVNAGEVQSADSFEKSVELITQSKRSS